jgi:hypothetical protein
MDVNVPVNAVFWATWNVQFSVVEVLVTAGADFNLKCLNDQSAWDIRRGNFSAWHQSEPFAALFVAATHS